MRKQLMALAIALYATPAFAQTAPRPPEVIATDLAATAQHQVALSAELQASLREQVVSADGNVQAALDQGGVIHLTAGASYAGTYVLHSRTTLIAHGATFTGAAGGPALYVPPGTEDVYVSDFAAGTPWDQSVVQIGRNDAGQTTVALAPKRIAIVGARIIGYRGKRGIEINGADVKVLQSFVNDVYDPAGRDSQAIAILNAPGPVLLDQNDLSAGTENILVGGDTMKIPGVYPTGITITRNHIWKPLTWQIDGVARGIKNLIELKTGRQVLIKGNALDGSWKNGQDGYAYVITPRAGGDIHDVLIEDETVAHVGAGFNILGRDDGTGSLIPTPAPLSNLVVRRVTLKAESKVYGGRGILALITGAPHDVTFDNVTATFDGNAIVQVDAPKILNPDGTLAGYKKIAGLTITNSRTTSGIYGIFTNGNVGGKNWPLFFDALTVTGNTIVDPTSGDARPAMHSLFPTNTYVDRVTFDALLAAQ